MDQTTDTADLTETEKYLRNTRAGGNIPIREQRNCQDQDSSDSDVDTAQDALLGGIRTGIRTIRRTTRKALSTCKNQTELDTATENIKMSTRALLKMEMSFMKTATIVSDVIEDLISDFEDEPSGVREDPSNPRYDKLGSGDATGNSDSADRNQEEPYVFSLSRSNLSSVIQFKEKLAGEFHKRLDAYKNSLPESTLENDKKFEALMKQINLGRNAEKSMNAKKHVKFVEKHLPTDEVPESGSISEFLASIPYSKEELRAHKYKPYNDDKEMDDTVLPTDDPITRAPIEIPVKNKYCHHVFDRNSIFAYIDGNTDPKCPVYMCQNRRSLDKADFVSDRVLTAHVHRKNNLL